MTPSSGSATAWAPATVGVDEPLEPLERKSASAPVLRLPVRRSLPLGVELTPGESLDSWVEAMASRYETTTGVILDALGIRLPSSMPVVLLRLPARVMTRVAHLTGISDSDLAAAAGTGTPAAAWLAGCRSRYCPACLAETGGRWQLTWRATVTTACLRHQLMLADGCPVCGAFPRVWLTGAPSPLHCTYRQPDGTRCATDLSLTPHVPIPSTLGDAQRWACRFLTLAAQVEPAGSLLADIPIVLSWLERMERLLPADNIDRPNQAGRYRDAEATARLLPDVAAILGAENEASIARIGAVIRAAGPPYTVIPRGLSPTSFHNLSGPFAGRYRRAIDPYLDGPDRLRHRTTSPDARRPTGVPPARVAGIPELLWPDWYARLLPPTGVLGDRARSAYASALLMPGLRARRLDPALAVLNEHRTPATVAEVLRAYPADDQTAVLTVLTRLADYLDGNPRVIDYQRRRLVLDAHPLIGWKQWRTLAVTANTHPGHSPRSDRPPNARLVHAGRYLHVLLCGTDLTNPRHEFAWTDAADRGRYHAFVDAMARALRAALHQYAQDLLVDLDIPEPVSWSPPMELASGLNLPGIDPSSLDPAAIEDVASRRRRPGEAAASLGVHIDHVRLAIEALRPPTVPLGPVATARLTSLQRARAIATRDFLQQHYLQERRTLGDLSRMTGVPQYALTIVAHEHGIPLRHGIDPCRPDPGWLHEQYVTQGRTCADMAQELGVTSETLRRAFKRAGINMREAGVYARREMRMRAEHAHAPIVRAATERNLNGWRRLARFQAAIVYPSMTAAATALGLHHIALTEQVQRLERDTGGQLYVRAAYGKPQHLTPHGQALLDALDPPSTSAALRRATGPAPDPPDPATLTALRAELSVRAPARATAAYPGLAVKPLRRTKATLAVLGYLAEHTDNDVWGYTIARDVGLYHGTVYPLLHHLHEGGWVTRREETVAEWWARAPHRRGDGRRRTYYRLTAQGVLAREALRRLPSRAQALMHTPKRGA